MKIILGLIVIGIGFKFAFQHLNQNLLMFWDVIAFSLVIGGTIAVAIMTMPSLKFHHCLRLIFRGLRNNQGHREKGIKETLSVFQGEVSNKKIKRIDQKLIKEGEELFQLGFEKEKIEEILSMRAEKYLAESMSVANWIRGLSKYPPAFGLAGTVLGLIHLMSGFTQGADPKETGIRMAVALLATFYGIVVANIFVNPIGDRIFANVKEDKILAELAINTLMLKLESANYVEVVETMNNFVPTQYKKLRFDFGQVEVA